MFNFIEDYLADPSKAIASAARNIRSNGRPDDIDDEMIYSELATGEFRLYQEIIFSTSTDGLHGSDYVRPVA